MRGKTEGLREIGLDRRSISRRGVDPCEDEPMPPVGGLSVDRHANLNPGRWKPCLSLENLRANRVGRRRPRLGGDRRVGQFLCFRQISLSQRGVARPSALHRNQGRDLREGEDERASDDHDTKQRPHPDRGPPSQATGTRHGRATQRKGSDRAHLPHPVDSGIGEEDDVGGDQARVRQALVRRPSACEPKLPPRAALPAPRASPADRVARARPAALGTASARRG